MLTTLSIVSFDQGKIYGAQRRAAVDGETGDDLEILAAALSMEGTTSTARTWTAGRRLASHLSQVIHWVGTLGRQPYHR